MRNVGPIVAIGFCLAAFLLSLRSGLAYGGANAVSLGAGALAIVAMSQCLVLAARPGFLEPLFGGLDRMYRMHKWLGIAALAAMVLHDQIEPDFERWARETGLGEVGEAFGEIGFYSLLALILFSWIKRIPLLGWEVPYNLWWFTHRLTGAFFALAILHQLLIDTPFAWDDPLLLLLDGAGLLGIACYLFVEFVARRWRARRFVVAALERDSGATRLTLLPKGRPLRWRPGQFAFLSAPGSGLGEPHPFTIAGRPEPDHSLRFAIKPRGDWTRRLPARLDLGAEVELEGPYGRFDFREGGARQVWVAGGVGITPFLAWAHSLPDSRIREIHLLYVVRKADEAIGLDTLEAAADALDGFSFDLAVTERDGRPQARHLIEGAPFALEGADFFFCGPVGLRTALLKELAAAGVAPRRVHFELFEFR